MRSGASASSGAAANEYQCLFRIGEFAYQGPVRFDGLHLDLHDLPLLIPHLQRQQKNLSYFSRASRIPKASPFDKPLRLLYRAVDFVMNEMMNEQAQRELAKWKNLYNWLDDDDEETFFELGLRQTPLPAYLDNVAMMMGKTIVHGLVLTSVYHAGSVFITVHPPGPDGALPLVDSRFPILTCHGHGLFIASYESYESSAASAQGGGAEEAEEAEKAGSTNTRRRRERGLQREEDFLSRASDRPWKRLTLWHSVAEDMPIGREAPPTKTVRSTSVCFCPPFFYLPLSIYSTCV
jgi:hypothetical protein